MPCNALRQQLEGSSTHRVAAARFQRLSPVQENLLVEWICTQGALGLPLTHSSVRYFVTRILVEGGHVRLLGKR